MECHKASERLGHYAQERLSGRGVAIRLKSEVTGYDGKEATLNDGTRIATCILIWTAGITPAPLLSMSEAEESSTVEEKRKLA